MGFKEIVECDKCGREIENREYVLIKYQKTFLDRMETIERVVCYLCFNKLELQKEPIT
jgi:hypothetical protein